MRQERNEQALQLVEEQSEEVGGFIGPNKEAICEACSEHQPGIPLDDYTYFPPAPGWPRFTCEYCGEDF
jgi:hypothetical protein